jgi:hypothetical protein
MWRLTTEDLRFFGFYVKMANPKSGVQAADQEGLHINPLEFLAAIVNLWLCLTLVRFLPPCHMGYIIDLFSDNTSALSWMKVTATLRPPKNPFSIRSMRP